MFSDKPCPEEGNALPAKRLIPNLAQGQAQEAQPAATSAPARDVVVREAPRVESPPPANSCPSDAQLRSMETSASAVTLGSKAREFLNEEIRRVLQCRKGQGRYTDADWRISREARDAQSGLSDRAAAARRRAEDMHSAADPLEGERIARQRALEGLHPPRPPMPLLP